MTKKDFTFKEIKAQMDRYINYFLGTNDPMPYKEFAGAFYQLNIAGFIPDYLWKEIFEYDMQLQHQYKVYDACLFLER